MSSFSYSSSSCSGENIQKLIPRKGGNEIGTSVPGLNASELETSKKRQELQVKVIYMRKSAEVKAINLKLEF